MIGRVTGFLGVMIFAILASNLAFAQNQLSQEKHAVPGVVIVKLKSSPNNLRVGGNKPSPLNIIQNIFDTKDIQAVLPVSTGSRVSSTKSGLERIYTIQVDNNTDVFRLSRQIESLEGIEYAEPLYENKPLYIPNDPYSNPSGGSQYHLANIRAYDAWNLEKGDTNVVVGIIDTGVDIDHPDLLPNIAINHNDPVNGVDDDLDGYIDNYLGWDIADDDNNPNTDGSGHGDVVAGIASAKANNGIGVAGIGFNCRFLPVKIMENSSQKLRNEYSGVIYAANHGVKVINLSWGSPWGYSKFAQDVINYAVLDRDVVVVAAAGNTHDFIDFYPASFDNVLSVAATDENDNFASWATYSYKIDIMAPGQSIFSAKTGGGYGQGGFGTSFASPMVAAAAALVRSRFPNLDARQVMEQLRVTSDDVSNIGSNSQYKGKIGRGRLNVYEALADTTRSSVRLEDFSYTGKYGKYIFPGDTVRIFPTFINYLKEAKNFTITLSSADTNSISQQKVYALSSIKTYESKGVGEDYWEVVLNENLLPNTRAFFRIDYQIGDFSDYEYFYLDTNPTYFDIENNGLSLTVSSDGDLGYDRDSFNWGNGVWLDLEKISNYMGVIISRNKDYVADNVVNNYSILTKDKDFEPVKYARLYDNSIADIDARSTFREGGNLNKQGLEIEQKILGWSDNPGDNYFVMEYRLINKSDSVLNGINVSFYADYDLKDKATNTSDYDPSTGLSYAYNKIGNQIFAGLSLLTSGDSVVYSFDLQNINGNIADFQQYFPDSLKYKYSSSAIDKTTAGVNGNGNDVANMVGLKDFALNPGESKKVAFAIMAGGSLSDLQSQLSSAKSKYNSYLTNPPADYFVYSCKGGAASLSPKKGESFEIYSDPYLQNQLDSGNVFNINDIEGDTSFFVVEIADGIKEDLRKAYVILKEPVADFVSSQDTLMISGEMLDTIRYINKTTNADQFSWDFGNGYFGKVKDPVVQYNSPGVFQVQMIAKNSLGCDDTISHQQVVVARSAKPKISDLVLCKGAAAHLKASNTNFIRVYSDEKLTNKLFEGSEFVSSSLFESQNFYVTNIDGYESLPVEVKVTVSNPVANFKYSVAVENSSKLLRVENLSQNAVSYEWQINSEMLSGGDTIYYDYSAQSSVDIALLAYDSISCADSKQLSINPAKSPLPKVADMEVCKNSTASIAPQGGSEFLFYSDSQKQNLLSAGSALVFGPVTRDTLFYVSNIDSLKESDLAEVHIIVSSFRARISIRQDSLDLTQNNTVEISNLSEGADYSYFLWPSGAIDTTKNVVKTIEEPGDYLFTVVAKSANNCTDTATASLIAYVITSQKSFADYYLNVYPNPADSYLNVDFARDDNFRTLDILDASGKVVYSQQLYSSNTKNLEIETSHLSNGIYLLRLQGKNDQRVMRIAINR